MIELKILTNLILIAWLVEPDSTNLNLVPGLSRLALESAIK